MEARKSANGKELMGAVVKIGYAKVPSGKEAAPVMTPTSSLATPVEWQDSIPSNNVPTKRLGNSHSWSSAYDDKYISLIPSIPDGPVRLDTVKMKDYRKRIEGNITYDVFNEIFMAVLQNAPAISAGKSCLDS